MKGFIVVLLCLFCLFCLSGCGGYSLEGTWVGGVGGVEFRSDGSIVALGQKAEGLTWHGDYICLKADIKKLRDARRKQLTGESQHFHAYPHLRTADEIKSIDQQLEDLKNGKVMEAGDYFPTTANLMEAASSTAASSTAALLTGVYFSSVKGVDKKDISESADKVEFRIHWVDADHFDLGSTSYSRVKLPK